MPKIQKPLEFEWDEHNQDKNWFRHQVDFKECEEVFHNHPQCSFRDLVHSINEKRYTLLGFTNQNRFIFLTYTIRSNKARVISARDMDKKERKLYEQKTK